MRVELQGTQGTTLLLCVLIVGCICCLWLSYFVLRFWPKACFGWILGREVGVPVAGY